VAAAVVFLVWGVFFFFEKISIYDNDVEILFLFSDVTIYTVWYNIEFDFPKLIIFEIF